MRGVPMFGGFCREGEGAASAQQLHGERDF